jgi:phage terminase small subunit
VTLPELTVRQARFCTEYIVDLNGEKAATRAGYSPKTAKSQASRLLTKANAKAEIARLQAKRSERTEITAERVLIELAKLGFANMADYMTAGLGGDPYLDFSALTRDQAAALQEVTVDTYVEGHGDEARDVKRVKFKLADKRAALVEIGRHLGVAQRHEVTGKDGEPLVPAAEPSKVALVLLGILQAARPETETEPT